MFSIVHYSLSQGFDVGSIFSRVIYVDSTNIEGSLGSTMSKTVHISTLLPKLVWRYAAVAFGKEIERFWLWFTLDKRAIAEIAHDVYFFTLASTGIEFIMEHRLCTCEGRGVCVSCIVELGMSTDDPDLNVIENKDEIRADLIRISLRVVDHASVMKRIETVGVGVWTSDTLDYLRRANWFETGVVEWMSRSVDTYVDMTRSKCLRPAELWRRVRDSCSRAASRLSFENMSRRGKRHVVLDDHGMIESTTVPFTGLITSPDGVTNLVTRPMVQSFGLTSNAVAKRPDWDT